MSSDRVWVVEDLVVWTGRHGCKKSKWFSRDVRLGRGEALGIRQANIAWYLERGEKPPKMRVVPYVREEK